jgi:UDP-3-O-[3-hydroxymyristoyl] glucosamine N-acyltransferase LpxD
LLRATLQEQEIRGLIGAPGDGERELDGVAPLNVHEDRCLYFISGTPPDDVREALARLSGCVVITRAGSNLQGALGDCTVLEAPDPKAAIAKVLAFIRDGHRQQALVAQNNVHSSAQISPRAFVEPPVDIGEGVVIEPFCVIGPDVKIGRGSVIRSGVRLFPRVRVGEESVVGVNTVIGQQGYGFVRDAEGNKTRIPHLGGVEIGSHVEIGVLVSVPSGTIAPTVIEDYAKVDELVHVSHNVRLGRNVSLTAGAITGGHAEIDDEAWIGMNATIRDGRRVGRNALVGMDASVQQDLPDNSIARAPRPAVEEHRDSDPNAIGFARRDPK